MDIVVLGVDLGKNSCSLAGLDASGRVILRRRMRRSSVESFVKGLGPCIVAMEACCGAHHMGRVLAGQDEPPIVRFRKWLPAAEPAPEEPQPAELESA